MLGSQTRTQWKSASRRSPRRRMQLSVVATGAAIASLWLIASADDGAAARSVPVIPSVAMLSDVPSHNRVYRASMVPSPDRIERNRPLTWTVEVRTAAGASVERATLSLESWMPDDESARVARPRATEELGGGRYRVGGIRFDHGGWWNVRLQISAAGVTDSLAFNLVL